MATKTITITEDAYLALKREKLPGESFSEVIRRKFGRSSARGLIGLLTASEAEAIEKGIAERRKARAARSARRRDGRL